MIEKRMRPRVRGVKIVEIEAAKADPFHYRVVFRPETILPDVDLKVSVAQ